MPGQAVAIGLGCAEKTQSITAITETAIYNARVKPKAAVEAAQGLAYGKDAKRTITNATLLLNGTVTEVSIASIQRLEWCAQYVSITVGYRGSNGAGKLVFGVEDSGLRQACVSTLLSLRPDLRPAEIARTPFEAIKGYLIALAITVVIGGAFIMVSLDGPIATDSTHGRRSSLKQLFGIVINALGPTSMIGLVAVLVVIQIMLLVQAVQNAGTKFVAERNTA